MSYDLFLFRRDTKNPLHKSEVVEKLKGKFEKVDEYIEEENVLGFDIGEKTSEDLISFDYQNEGEQKGSYWTYCSYGIPPEMFESFKGLVRGIAEELDMQIQDPQVSEELIEPKDFAFESDSAYKNTQKVTKQVVKGLGLRPALPKEWEEPAKEKYFFIYYITSQDPDTLKTLHLTISGNQVYASKVNKGEYLDQVVKKDIPDLTGSDKYTIWEVSKNYDTAKDREGNTLPRHVVKIEVPYFDPSERKTKQPMQWVALK